MKKDYKYHYVYRITNTVTGYHYYGSKSCNEHPTENIGEKYFSTSTNKLFIQDQKNNPQDYKYKVIKIFETCRKDATQLEVDLHKKFDVKTHPKFINKANQTSSGFDTTGTSLSDERKKQISKEQQGRKDSFETRKKKSISMKGRKITWGAKISESCKGRKPWNKGLKLLEQSGEKNSFYGKSHDFETKQKISDSTKKQWNNYSNEEKNEIILKRSETTIKNGSQKGKNNPQAKQYKIISPKNIEYYCVGSMKEFCKSHNLCMHTMYDIAKGIKPKTKRSRHYGWSVKEISD